MFGRTIATNPHIQCGLTATNNYQFANKLFAAYALRVCALFVVKFALWTCTMRIITSAPSSEIRHTSECIINMGNRLLTILSDCLRVFNASDFKNCGWSLCAHFGLLMITDRANLSSSTSMRPSNRSITYILHDVYKTEKPRNQQRPKHINYRPNCGWFLRRRRLSVVIIYTLRVSLLAY